MTLADHVAPGVVTEKPASPWSQMFAVPREAVVAGMSEEAAAYAWSRFLRIWHFEVVDHGYWHVMPNGALKFMAD